MVYAARNLPSSIQQSDMKRLEQCVTWMLIGNACNKYLLLVERHASIDRTSLSRVVPSTLEINCAIYMKYSDT